MKPTRRAPVAFHYALRVASLVVTLAGCAVVLSPIGVDIPFVLPEQQINGNPAANAAGVAVAMSPAIFQIAATAAKAQHIDDVSHLTLTSLSLTITSTDEPAGTSYCFDFVESITVTVASTMKGSTLPSIVAATGTSEGCVQTFELTPAPDIDLKPYAEEGVSVTVTGLAVPPAHDVSFDGALVLHAQL